MASERVSLSEFYDNNRSGVVLKSEAGYEVDLYENDVFERTVEVHTHSESYAENVAENWCSKLIK